MHTHVYMQVDNIHGRIEREREREFGFIDFHFLTIFESPNRMSKLKTQFD